MSLSDLADQFHLTDLPLMFLAPIRARLFSINLPLEISRNDARRKACIRFPLLAAKIAECITSDITELASPERGPCRDAKT